MKQFINLGFETELEQRHIQRPSKLLFDFKSDLSAIRLDTLAHVASRLQDYYASIDRALGDLQAEVESQKEKTQEDADTANANIENDFTKVLFAAREKL